MRRGAARLANCVFLVACAAGCGHHLHRTTSTPKPAAPSLPVVARSVIAPDVSGLPLETRGPAPARPGEYRKLTAAECRHLAIKNAPFADDLDSHPVNRSSSHPLFHPRQSSPEEAEVGRKVRGYLADDFRNKAAGEALEQFFHLSQAEGQFDSILYCNSLEHISGVLSELRQASAACRAGGTLVIFGPAMELIYGEIDRLSGHFRRFTIARLSHCVEQAGFEVLDARYADPIGALMYGVSNRLLKNGSLRPGLLPFYEKVILPLSKATTPLTKHLMGKNVVLVARRVDDLNRHVDG